MYAYAQSKVEICGVNTAKLQTLKNDEMRELLDRSHHGDKDARDKLICGNLRLVLSVIQRFTSRGENPDDLFQVGCIGLIKAIDNFDPSHEVMFSTYGVPMISGEVKRFLRDNNAVRVSRSMRDTAYRAMQIKEQLTNENGKEPNITEIAKRMELPDFTEDMTDFDVDDIGDGVELEGMDMPSPDDYLSALQKDGKPLGADEIYKETWLWLKERGCERLVNKRLLESYSEAFARYIQCSEAVSKYGMLGKHPTTGAAIASPFTQLLMNFQKQANLLWYEIYDIVKQNCTEPFEGSPQDSVMEQLLRSRRNM